MENRKKACEYVQLLRKNNIMKIETVDRVVTDSPLRSSFHELSQAKPKHLNVFRAIPQNEKKAHR